LNDEIGYKRVPLSTPKITLDLNSAARQFTADPYLPFKASSSAGSKPFLFWGSIIVF
jgi:hypothetical protein